MTEARERVRRPTYEELSRRPAFFVTVLFTVLFIANVAVIPQFVAASNVAGTLAIAAPFVIAAIASTPAVLSGGGGLDLSIGPLVGLVNVVLVAELMPRDLADPWPALPLLLALGAVIGFVNGVLVAVVRVPPMVATLGTYLVITGASVIVMPEPLGEAPDWVARFSGSFGPVPGAVVLVGVAAAAWAAVRRLPYHTALLAVGGDERAAYSAGIDVRLVRLVAYTVGGVLAVIAGIALTALIKSGDPLIGPQYTLVAIAAVALGGTSLAGGRGGIYGPALGALCIFLIQNLLTAAHVSALWLQTAYGAILVAAVVVNAVTRGVAMNRRSEEVAA
jgi:ribose transport system permease protein